ncbi:unnamed protein product [Caenorhabditis angaria]|uniref:Uncharacterized protein n=1 Tax=Caenorhabditis angaria TaxID=860376 RepID=A0A9P1IR84_9PELO|nr:unnamed protein product [Caenorhabditis angaria]
MDWQQAISCQSLIRSMSAVRLQLGKYTVKIGQKHCAPYDIVIDKSQPGLGMKLAIFAPDSTGSRCARRMEKTKARSIFIPG